MHDLFCHIVGMVVSLTDQ